MGCEGHSLAHVKIRQRSDEVQANLDAAPLPVPGAWLTQVVTTLVGGRRGFFAHACVSNLYDLHLHLLCTFSICLDSPSLL